MSIDLKIYRKGPQKYSLILEYGASWNLHGMVSL